MGKDGAGGSGGYGGSNENSRNVVSISPKDLEVRDKRIKQLEDSMRAQGLIVPQKPDETLAEDEWWAVFSDYRDVTTGVLSKIPPQSGSNMRSIFKVKRIQGS